LSNPLISEQHLLHKPAINVYYNQTSGIKYGLTDILIAILLSFLRIALHQISA